MLRCCLNNGIYAARHDQTQGVPVGEGVHSFHTSQCSERLGWCGIGKGDKDLMTLDVLELRHTAYTHQCALAYDPYACTDLLYLTQDMRGEEDSAPVIAHLAHHCIKLLLVQGIKAIGRLVEHEQTRAVHKRLNKSNLAL